MTRMLSEILEQPDILAGIERKNETTLIRLVAELNERKINHAVFAGRGTSDHASIYGQYLLGIYKGVVSTLAIPSCITLYEGEFDFKDDLVIGVSQSGEAADALAVMMQANECGAVTVAITNNTESPMAKSAKYHLYCFAGMEKSVAATKTFTAQMYLIALLTAYWSKDADLLEHLRMLPAFAGEMLACHQGEIKKYVERYRFMKEGFILSRGITYPIALEAALKIQETCYIKMKGYAISDFYHGPLAQLDMDVPVFIFAPEGKVSEDFKALIPRIEKIGIQPLIVTDDVFLNEHSKSSILLPCTGSEATQAFLFAIFAQRFAEYLSVSKGLNPDKPRLLKKVTITK